MQISLAEQRTPEWFKLHIGRFSASEIHKIIGKDSKKLTKGAKSYILGKVKEIAYNRIKETPTTDAMQRGIDLEPDAAKAYQIKFGVFASSVGFYYGDHYGASPDKIVGEHGGIEIKCPGTKHIDHCLLTTPEDLERVEKAYFWQCYMNMLCTGRFWWDFVSFDPSPELPQHLRLHTIRIERKDSKMKKLVDALELAIIEKKRILKQLKIDV
jgi:exodeoxyribonuclease (lambda-induced)